MKKFLLIVSIVIVAGGIVAGCSMGKQSSNSNRSSTSKGLKDEVKVTVNEAVDVYEKKFPGINVLSVELKEEMGKPLYIIEGADDTTEYQLNINAVNKKIKQKSEEPVDEDDLNEVKTKKLDIDKVISLKKADQIAEKETNGGQGSEFKLEKEHGTNIWEVSVKDREIIINAETGKVVKVDDD